MAASSKERLSTKSPKSSVGIFSKSYLLLYNFIQFLGWTAILVFAIQHLTKTKNHIGLWKSVEFPLKIFQTAAILEIVHCMVGLVPSSAVITGVQVFSRLFLTWAVAHSVKQVQTNIGIALFVFAWAVAEVIRYPFYLTNLLAATPYPLMWCRYTFFILLYPIGVAGELLTTYAALPFVNRSKLFFLELPNRANLSFNFYYYLIVLMLLYIPFFPRLYCYMFQQRKKFISTPKGKKQ